MEVFEPEAPMYFMPVASVESRFPVLVEAVIIPA